jgi:hypothetical protein
MICMPDVSGAVIKEARTARLIRRAVSIEETGHTPCTYNRSWNHDDVVGE